MSNQNFMSKNHRSNRPGIFLYFLLPALSICLFSFSDQNTADGFTARKPTSDTTPVLATLRQNEIKRLPANNDTVIKNSSEVSLDVEASYPGGSSGWLHYLIREFRYPEKAQRLQITGRVVVHFTVDEKGRVSKIEALTGHPILQDEAKRVVRNSGRWLPAQHNGQSVVSEKEQAITFRLESRNDAPQTAKSNSVSDSSTNPFASGEIESSFPGGPGAWMRYLNKTFRFPWEAQRDNIQGTVVVQFIVDKDGSVSDVEAISGPTSGGLREEAVRVIRKSGVWLPASKDGVPVKSYKKLPITFQLEPR